MKIVGWFALLAPFIFLFAGFLASVFLITYRYLSEAFGISVWEGLDTIFKWWTVASFVILMLMLMKAMNNDASASKKSDEDSK